ncbi:hypothetical protein SALBM311S_07983 [Streptomyces alboniger]
MKGGIPAPGSHPFGCSYRYRSSARSTRPDAGFGPNDVDLRGMVMPRRARSRHDVLADRVHKDGRTAVTLGLLDRGRRVVDIGDAGGVVLGDVPDVVEENGMQDGRVEGAPGGGMLGGDRVGQQGRIRAVDQMEGPVAGQQERVALAGRVRQGLQRLRQRHFEAVDAEQAVQGGHRVRDGQAVQEAVNGADAQGVAGRVDEEDQAVVPGAGEGCSARRRR